MTAPLPGRTPPPSPGTFRALRHRDFRLLWLGQVASLTGTWMQSVAQGWLVLRLSNSPLLLGVVGFATYVPILLLALPAGHAADRLPRRRALTWTQGTAMVLAGILGTITWLGVVQVWHVVLLALGLGSAVAFDIPIRQAFLQDLVGRDDLPNAIALNSMAFNAARTVGPALAGILVALWGEGPCFLLNSLSYLAVLAALIAIRTPDRPAAPGGPSLADGVREGLRYARRDPPVRVLLGMVVTSSVLAVPYSILMPIFARDVLAVGSQGLGFLMGAAGVGAVSGALVLARVRSPQPLGRIVPVGMAAFGGSLVVFGLSRSFPLSLAAVFVAGAAMLSQMAGTNTLLQLTAPAHLRGRAVSLFMLSFVGMAPLGSLVAGALASRIGAPATVGIGGAACLAVALLAWRVLRSSLAQSPSPDAG